MIYLLVGVAWKEDKINDTNAQGISKKNKYLEVLVVNLISILTSNLAKIKISTRSINLERNFCHICHQGLKIRDLQSGPIKSRFIRKSWDTCRLHAPRCPIGSHISCRPPCIRRWMNNKIQTFYGPRRGLRARMMAWEAVHSTPNYAACRFL